MIVKADHLTEVEKMVLLSRLVKEQEMQDYIKKILTKEGETKDLVN
jgi:hypothetical protein